MNSTTQTAALPNRTGAAHPQAAREFPPRRTPPPPEPSVTSHGMEYRALFGQVGSTPTPRLCSFLESSEN